jgi:hypothetical protein
MAVKRRKGRHLAASRLRIPGASPDSRFRRPPRDFPTGKVVDNLQLIARISLCHQRSFVGAEAAAVLPEGVLLSSPRLPARLRLPDCPGRNAFVAAVYGAPGCKVDFTSACQGRARLESVGKSGVLLDHPAAPSSSPGMAQYARTQ